MNYFILTAGVLSSIATIGHFAMGTKSFLNPVLTSNIDEIPKKVMESIFHYLSVLMILTSVVLLAISIGYNITFESTADVVKIIGTIYACFAVVQLYIAATSSIKMGVFKLFQWIFWTLIAVFSFLGV
jgi:hypothetical protein